MSYFDVFWLLKLSVMGALLVALSLSISLLIQRLGRRSAQAVVELDQAVQAQAAPPLEAITEEAITEPPLEAITASPSETIIAPQIEPEIAVKISPQESSRPLESTTSFDEAPECGREPELSKASELRKAFENCTTQARHAEEPEDIPSQARAHQRVSFQQMLTDLDEQESVYQPSGGLLTPDERQVFKTLKSCLPSPLTVMCKVRSADLLSSESFQIKSFQVKSNQFELIKLIATQYFTFVICHEETLDPYGFVELYHSDVENQPTHHGRLNVLRQLAKEVGFPMTLLDVQEGYSASELSHHFSALLGDHEGTRVPNYSYLSLKSTLPREEEQLVASAIPAISQQNRATCPECREPMHYRVSRSGKYQGRVFHTCQDYPSCSHIQLMPMADNASHATHEQPARQFA